MARVPQSVKLPVLPKELRSSFEVRGVATRIPRSCALSAIGARADFRRMTTRSSGRTRRPGGFNGAPRLEHWREGCSSKVFSLLTRHGRSVP